MLLDGKRHEHREIGFLFSLGAMAHLSRADELMEEAIIMHKGDADLF